MRTFAYKRLKLLDYSFKMHKNLNGSIEEEWNRTHKMDFYTVHKVDTHVHLAAAFSAKKFAEFIKDKFANHKEDVVDSSTGQTLGQVAEKIGLNFSSVSVDSIDVQADESIFQRFDHFNAKYNPCGNSTLRKLASDTL